MRDKVRERAREERKTQRAQGQKKSLLRRVRRATRARRIRAARARSARLRKKGLKTVSKKAVKFGAKKAAAGAAGVAAGVAAGAATGTAGAIAVAAVVAVVTLAEIVIAGGRAARRLSGHSARLVDATDADTLYGGMDEAIAADLATVGFVEGNEDLLRIIGREGRVNSQIKDMMHEKRRLFLMRAQGIDLINRSPDLDSPDTLIDQLVKAARREDLRGLADKAGAGIRSKTLKGPTKTGR